MPLADNRGRVAAYRHLSDQCLKSLLIECEAGAAQQMLDMGSAVSCFRSYEALLTHGFGGDFGAMTDWWRTQRATQAVR